MPIDDDFLLNRTTPFDLAQGAEADAFLTLQPNPNVNSGSIFGIVTAAGVPVHNATVKLLTPSGSPVAHDTTTGDGFYTMPIVAPNPYQIVAIAPGFAVSAPVSFTLSPKQERHIDIALTADPRTLLSNVYGLLFNQTSGARLSGAVVTLTLTDGTIVSVTNSNSDGQYLLCAVASGNYILFASKEGFVTTSVPVTLVGPSIVNEDLNLVPEVTVPGTVSGRILNPSGGAIANAFVGLYTVSGTTETLTQTTFTNPQGVYLFAMVNAGRYVVKSLREVLGSDPPVSVAMAL